MRQASRNTEFPPAPREDAPLAEWARWCAEIGRLTGAFKVFPCIPGEKRPLHKDWQDEAVCDPKTVATMWQNDPGANIGLAIQPGFVVLDADLYKPGAEAALDAFEAKHGALPDTLESRSARGGVHLIYATSKVLGNGKGSLPDFGDVRGHGGFIVGPGSTFEGKRYVVEHLSWPASLPSLVEGMLFERKARDRSKPDVPARFVLVDDPRNVQFFADWCAGKSVRTITTPNGEVAEPCIDGQGGNNKLAATGAMAHDYGLSEDKAAEAAFEHFNPRCEPPWDEDEFDKHFRSGYRSASGSLGCRAPARDHRSLFKCVPAGKAANDKAPVFYYLDDLDAIPEPTWVINGILPEGGYTLLYGRRSTKKSFAALDMALSIATGTPYHGRAVARGRVVYFAGEGFRGTRRRIKAWFKARKLNMADFSRDFALIPLTSKWDTSSGLETVLHLLRKIAEDGPISFVVIDTARRAMSGDENAPTSVGHFLDGVSGVCREFGCGHIIVHHAGKDESKGARGGGPFEDDADAVFHLTKGAESVHMKCTKQKDAEADWVMKFRAEQISLGHEADGKQITSLALTLESEDKSTDDAEGVAAPSDRDQYAPYDRTAARILESSEDPSLNRTALATAVMGELAAEMRDSDPSAFHKAVRKYSAHLMRLTPTKALWRYVERRNEKGQPISFHNPNQRGRRAPKTNRRCGLNYTLPRNGAQTEEGHFDGNTNG